MTFFSKIIRYAIAVAAVAGASYFSSQASRPAVHKVAKGESIYGIASEYNISVDSLILLNPFAAEGIRPGDKLVLIAPVKKPEVIVAPNPGKAVEVIEATKVPETPADTKRFEAVETPEEEVVMISEADTAALQAPQVVDTNPEEMETTVAVLLPFMLNESKPGRQAQLSTEFFRGMLMAAEKHAHKTGAHVTLLAFDTCNSTDTVKSLLTLPEVYTADFIIAPDQTEQIALINENAPQALVLNFFSVRDNSYKRHRNSIQANIPHDEMYESAIHGFMNLYRDFTPVFLRRDGGATDKDEFVTKLKAELEAADRPYQEVVYNVTLGEEHLADLRPMVDQLVFVPNSSRPAEFSKFITALSEFSDKSTFTDSPALWGYPEWVTFTGDALDQMGKLHTTIYSRYYVVPDDYEAKALADDYKRLFDTEMSNAVPSQGILGYDVASFAINSLRAMAQANTDEPVILNYEGVQNILDLQRVDDSYDAGLVNTGLFFIRYNPSGRIEKLNPR